MTNSSIRKPARWLASLAAAALVVAGCAVDDENGDDGGEPGAVESGDLKLATGSTGGTYYPLGGEIAKVWSSTVEGVTVSTQATGASVENLRLLDSGTNDLAMAVNGTVLQAINGEADFTDEQLANPDDILAIGNVYPEVTHVVTTADSGIESIEDLKGKRVEIGPAGSATQGTAKAILEAHGIDPDNDLGAVFDSAFGDAAAKLGDREVDAAFGILGLPAGSIEQVATTSDIVLLGITGDPLQTLLDADSTLSELEIEADTYSGQDEAVMTITNWATMTTTSALSEDLVYELCKTMYESSGDVAHAEAENISTDNALLGLGEIPLHPGAIRYYEEQGVDLP